MRPPVRSRYRVPPGEDVLAAPGAGAGGLAEAGARRTGPRSPWSTRWPSTPRLWPEVLDGPGVMVAHAASQDLEVSGRACGVCRRNFRHSGRGRLPRLWFRLARVARRTFHRVRLAKGDRLTDWSRRPLTPSQVSYAASDVAHLLALADVFRRS